MANNTDAVKNITIGIPREWHDILENIARTRAFKEKKNINRLDLVREALIEKYGLEYPDKEQP